MMGVKQVPAGRPTNGLLTDSQVARAPYRKQRVCGEPSTAWRDLPFSGAVTPLECLVLPRPTSLAAPQAVTPNR